MTFLKRLYFYLSWPGLLVYFAASRRARVVLVDSTGRIALVSGNFQRWYGHTDLGLPGGGIQRGEAPAQGASREIFEELGLRLATEQLLELGTGYVRQYGLGYRAYFFVAQLPSGTQLVPDGKEVTKVQWYSRQQLEATALKPDVQMAMRLLADHR